MKKLLIIVLVLVVTTVTVLAVYRYKPAYLENLNFSGTNVVAKTEIVVMSYKTVTSSEEAKCCGFVGDLPNPGQRIRIVSSLLVQSQRCSNRYDAAVLTWKAVGSNEKRTVSFTDGFGHGLANRVDNKEMYEICISSNSVPELVKVPN